MTPETPQPATKEDLAQLKAELLEAMRDMQSEILRSLETSGRGSLTRLHTLDTSDSDLAARLAALEERVFYLEVRRPTH